MEEFFANASCAEPAEGAGFDVPLCHLTGWLSDIDFEHGVGVSPRYRFDNAFNQHFSAYIEEALDRVV